MRPSRLALLGLACAAAAFATPAAAYYTIDPATREPIYYYPYYHYQRPQAPRPRARTSYRSIVSFNGPYEPGTVIVSTSERRLYYVLGDGKAVRYGIGVGRAGFQWAGTETITMKRAWPDWRPPAAMLRRRPDLPRYMSGGINNPLGARALYLGSTEYRIHGSNEPWTIGHAVSSGCIRMTNADVTDLYQRVSVGTTVVVLRGSAHAAVAAPRKAPQEGSGPATTGAIADSKTDGDTAASPAPQPAAPAVPPSQSN